MARRNRRREQSPLKIKPDRKLQGVHNQAAA